MTKRPPIQKEKAKTATHSFSQELNVDIDLRRLIEACSVLGDCVSHFTKRIKLELQRVKDGDQHDVPTVPLFLYGDIQYRELKLLFSEVLTTYPFLRVIQLHHCLIGDDGLLVVVDFIRSYKPTPDRNPFCIQCLEVPGCLIGPYGAKHIGKLLSENDTLTRCVLDFNPVGDSGAQAIAKGAKWNGSLEELFLQYCGIESLGAEALAEGVLCGSNVRVFSIRGNALGPDGIKHIASALSVGHRVESIDVADTRFGGSYQAVEAFCHGAESSKSLRSVDMDLNLVTPEAASLIAAVILRNQRLVQFNVNERMDPSYFFLIQSALEQNKRSTKTKKRAKK